MPRPLRIDYPGARHHVMNRGARHQQVFWADESYELFLDLLGEAVGRYGIVVHAYALMPNHFHLLIESVRGNLSKAMQNLQFRYSQEVNRAPGFDGALFRGRFKNKLVLEESHWYYLPMYLHLNPVRAHLVSTAEHYLWTSHGAYLDDKYRPTWLTTGEMMEYFDTEKGYKACFRSVVNGRWPMPPDFDDVLFGGGRSAKSMVVKQSEESPSLTPKKALQQVMKVTGVSRKEILTMRRGVSGNPARALAILWMIHGARLTNAETGKILGISPSAVSRIMKKYRDAPETYLGGKLIEWKEELLLNKDQ